ncbi:cation:proton antiporter [Altererythrobacter sp.]|nr:cation:proton antiporter [Altererythrobacter sp.]
MFTFAMLGQRLSKTSLTAPIVFIGVGYLLSITGWLPQEGAEEALHLLAEITLIVLLFLDASQIDLKALRRDHIWPQRMLLLGLPLAILFGTFAAWLFIPSWPIVALALVAALLAPTDAALGQSVVSNRTVPERVRRGLTVESGLNDGMALPIILLFASLAGNVIGGSETNWVLFGAMQILLGPLAGVAIGYAGGRAMMLAHKHGLTSDVFEGIGALSLAALAYLFAQEIGGNGFIAAFIGGLTFGNVVKGRCKFLFEFTESEGQILMWGAFFLLGLALVPEAIEQLSLPIFGLILVSLFVVRPLAIWFSLIGTDASPATRLFFGWFGPRGLATALFALLILPQFHDELAGPILAIAINAVWISALLHGLSAAPLGNKYGRMVAKMGDCPETEPVALPFDTQSDTNEKSKPSGP